MSYEIAMEKAGAKVVKFKRFGDYQGTWVALVEYEGKTGWVDGSFGSCSGCDAFEAEFSVGHYCGENYHGYGSVEYPVDGCAGCEEQTNRLALFGKRYLSEMVDQQDAELKWKQYSEDHKWDMESNNIYEFVKKNNS